MANNACVADLGCDVCIEDARRLVNEMSYADFVAFIRQPNAPPGGVETIFEWQKISAVSSKSNVLDLACSTGFSSRVLSLMTDCVGIGIDQSAAAVAEAIWQASLANVSFRLTYVVGDATQLPFAGDTFSHVIVGSSFGFIQSKALALSECRRVLRFDGALCVATFHYTLPPSLILLERVEKVIGYKPDSHRDRDYWREFFCDGFSIQSERHLSLQVLNVDQVEAAVTRFIYVESKAFSIAKPVWQSAAVERLRKIRLVLNEHRKYQAASILCLSKL